MDWIERWIGLNPDGGSGSLEWLLIGTIIVAVLTVLGGTRPAVREELGRLLGGVRVRVRARNARR
jgi:hypothetical protein